MYNDVQQQHHNLEPFLVPKNADDCMYEKLQKMNKNTNRKLEHYKVSAATVYRNKRF